MEPAIYTNKFTMTVNGGGCSEVNLTFFQASSEFSSEGLSQEIVTLPVAKLILPLSVAKALQTSLEDCLDDYCKKNSITFETQKANTPSVENKE